LQDEIIAWTEIKIPDVVLERGETHEDWYPLSGKTGDNKEGMIDLVLSFTSAACLYQRPTQQQSQQPVVLIPNVSGRSLPVFVQNPQPIMQQPMVQQQQQLPPPPVELTEQDISDLMEMFPSVDKEVIKSIADANHGHKEAIINQLLQLTN